MTRIHTDRTTAASRKKLTNAERCRLYRDSLAKDPQLLKKVRDDDKARAKRNRETPKTPEQIEHQRCLQRQRQKRYEEKKKQKAAADQASGVNSRPHTRLDKEKLVQRRERNSVAVRKHRANMTAQKRRRVNEKRMARHYEQKEQKRLAKEIKDKKQNQNRMFLSAGCPYPNKESFKRAVRRVRAKISAKGKKLAMLVKGLIKSADKKTSEAFKELNVTATTPEKSAQRNVEHHLDSIKNKRDKNTLKHKRRLAEAFRDCPEIGISQYMTKQQADTSPYSKRRPSQIQKDIRDFFENNSVENPCKNSTKRQLLQPVKELHTEFLKKTKSSVSLRSFHRHKPKNIASVTKLKFRQCLCEICMNPKKKLGRLTSMFVRKCEEVNVRELVNESLCEFEDAPNLLCVDRKCSGCGVHKIEKRLKECLGENVSKRVSWRKWERVDGHMDKVKKSGTAGECLQEMLQELGPLSRHIFNAEWQRKQIQQLKAKLPEGWAMMICDFAENFQCQLQDEPQSAHWGYKQVAVFPVVIFWRCGCGELRRDCLVFLSDDLCHDAHFVQVCVQQALQYLSPLVDLKKVVLVSDGCAAQFKSKLPFHFLSETQAPGGKNVGIEKVFFGAHHGKNDCDWCGGVVKRLVTSAIASGRVTVQTARDMYEYCCNTLSTSVVADKCQHQIQQFFLVEEHHIERKINSSMFKTVPGSRKFHQLKAVSPGVLETRELACYCSPCMMGQCDQCESPHHVDKWKVVKVKSNDSLPSAFHNDNGFSSAEEDSSESESSDFELYSDSSADEGSPVVSESEETDNDADVWVSDTSYQGESDNIQMPKTDVTSGDATVSVDSVWQLEGNSVDRTVFFSQLKDELQACSCFDDVQSLAREKKELMHSFTLPSLNVSSPAGSTIDRFSWLLLEPEIRSRCFPLDVFGDGNCFFRSLSRLLFGDERHHEEMRCRIVLEMAGNPKIFLDGKVWHGDHDSVSPDEITRVAKATSVSANNCLDIAFQEEVMAVKKQGIFVGLWELFAASLVTKCTIQSVHPSVGYPLYRLHCNRIIRAPGASSDDKMFIMWTSTHDDETSGDSWLPNHFVPLVLKSQCSTAPRRHAFYQVLWHGKTYIGQILERDELLELCCVSFLESTRKGGQNIYFWSHVPEISWEPVSAFQHEVTLHLVESLSNQRTQYFTAIQRLSA